MECAAPPHTLHAGAVHVSGMPPVKLYTLPVHGGSAETGIRVCADGGGGDLWVCVMDCVALSCDFKSKSGMRACMRRSVADISLQYRRFRKHVRGSCAVHVNDAKKVIHTLKKCKTVCAARVAAVESAVRKLRRATAEERDAMLVEFPPSAVGAGAAVADAGAEPLATELSERSVLEYTSTAMEEDVPALAVPAGPSQLPQQQCVQQGGAVAGIVVAGAVVTDSGAMADTW